MIAPYILKLPDAKLHDIAVRLIRQQNALKAELADVNRQLQQITAEQTIRAIVKPAKKV